MANTTILSDSKTLAYPDSKVFAYLSNFKNFQNILPAESVENYSASDERCTFYLVGISELTLFISEKIKYTTITYQSENNPYQISLRVHLSVGSNNTCNCQLELNAEFSKIIKLMAEKPLKSVLNKMLDKLAQLDFSV